MRRSRGSATDRPVARLRPGRARRRGQGLVGWLRLGSGPSRTPRGARQAASGALGTSRRTACPGADHAAATSRGPREAAPGDNCSAAPDPWLRGDPCSPPRRRPAGPPPGCIRPDWRTAPAPADAHRVVRLHLGHADQHADGGLAGRSRTVEHLVQADQPGTPALADVPEALEVSVVAGQPVQVPADHGVEDPVDQVGRSRSNPGRNAPSGPDALIGRCGRPRPGRAPR